MEGDLLEPTEDHRHVQEKYETPPEQVIVLLYLDLMRQLIGLVSDRSALHNVISLSLFLT